MGYKQYAKDYEIEYVDRPGKKRPKAVRIYVGPYYRFAADPQRVRQTRWLYLAGLMSLALFLLLPLCVTGTLARTWYVQVPAAVAWIPWVLAAASVWRLWTAGEKVDREHRDLTGGRMSGASLFLLIFSLISAVGAAVTAARIEPAREDWLVVGCMACAAVCSALLFVRRKDLAMIEVENPEKPQAKKK